MSMEPDIDRGHTGAKRSSWKKIHFRDLALKVCEEHQGAAIEELAEAFLEELQRYPDYMGSIAIYIMANIRASLEPGRSHRPRSSIEETVLKSVTAKVTTRVLMSLEMPGGKTLGQSTGAECIQAGGWLIKVGKHVGPAGIVGERVTEKQLMRMFKEAKK